MTDLRQALAHPEPEQKYDYRIKYDRPCYKCQSIFCPGNCKEPEHLAQPEQGNNSPNYPNTESNTPLDKIMKQALAQPEQEPVAWISGGGMRELFESGRTEVFRVQDYETTGTTPLYIAPPKREWVELTNEDIHTTEGYEEDRKMFRFAKALLAKAKGKNT